MAERGRPSEYDPKYIEAVEHYIDLCSDEVDENGKRIVKVPTTDGFARFIGVARSSLYLWEKSHQDFSDALEKIRIEQKERVLNKGLSGEYNSTIAKLILSANHGMQEKSATELSGPNGGPIQQEHSGNVITFVSYNEPGSK